jgi:two-component system, OmpR family, phosphate regulon response regulator OmpR
VLRRVAPPALLPPSAAVHFGAFSFSAASRTLSKAGQALKLTSGECAVLAALTSHAGHALTRDKLIGLTKGSGIEPFDRSIDVMIVRLRKLLEDDPKNPRWLQTVWGLGYVFAPAGNTANELGFGGHQQGENR